MRERIRDVLVHYWTDYSRRYTQEKNDQLGLIIHHIPHDGQLFLCADLGPPFNRGVTRDLRSGYTTRGQAYISRRAAI